LAGGVGFFEEVEWVHGGEGLDRGGTRGGVSIVKLSAGGVEAGGGV
jgi:hypothetical protein